VVLRGVVLCDAARCAKEYVFAVTPADRVRLEAIATPPASGIHPLSQCRRARGAGRQGDPCGARQLRHPQTPQDDGLAQAASTLHLPLHPDLLLLGHAVEGLFAKLTRQRLKPGVFTSIVDLQAAINRFIAETNDKPKPYSELDPENETVG
jgi:hypothetical protein